MKLVSTTPSSTNTTTAIDTAIAIGIAAVADTVTAESIATIATAAIAAFVIVGIVFVAGTVVVGVVKRLVVVVIVERIGIEMRYLRAVHLTMLEMFLVYCPFSNNRPDVKPGSSFSFPSFFCGYPSRACFYIP